jgi:thioredoxin-like negative regulator of GroEL
MIQRALILALIAVAVVVIVVLMRAWSAQRLIGLRARGHERLWSALGETPDGRPSLVVFSTPSCTTCRTAQYPAVETVAARFGAALRVISVDLAQRPAIGRAFNALTAPTTVVLAGDGRVDSFNHGFAPADRLSAQVSALGVSPASPR